MSLTASIVHLEDARRRQMMIDYIVKWYDTATPSERGSEYGSNIFRRLGKLGLTSLQSTDLRSVLNSPRTTTGDISLIYIAIKINE